MPDPRRRRRRRRYRGRLRPQFIIFCLVMALLLGGMIFLLVRCAAGDDEPADTPPVEDAGAAAPTIPEGYVPATADMGEGPLILVSNDHVYHFPEVDMVVSLEAQEGSDYLIRDYTIMQEEEAFGAFDAMLTDFATATGLTNVNITSAFRSYDEQENIFNNSAAANGLEHAQKYVTNPGHSEHHTGLAVDLNVRDSNGAWYDFNGEDEYKWIYDNCKEYGIILRYSLDKEYLTGISAESWHFRYVGVPHAAYMKENLLCLEEYIDLLRGYPVDKPLEYDGYTVYFCPKDALYVPQSGNYTVSGNNVDGYIVTISE